MEVQNVSGVPQEFSNYPAVTTDGKTTIRKVIDVSSWIALFAMLPFTILVLLSQNALPGDFFYGVKRGMETVVLAAASVNPATRSAFRTDLAKRRLNEAETLLLANLDNRGLGEFVTEVYAMQKEAEQITDAVQKQQALQKVQEAIVEYKEQLAAVKTQVIAKRQIYPTSVPPTAIPTQYQAPQPTNTPVPLPTNTPLPPSVGRPTRVVLSATPRATHAPQTTTVPSQTPIPSATNAPFPTPPPAGGPTDDSDIIGDIDAVGAYLKCLQEKPAALCPVPPGFSSNQGKDSNATHEERSSQTFDNDKKNDKDKEQKDDGKKDSYDKKD